MSTSHPKESLISLSEQLDGLLSQQISSGERILLKIYKYIAQHIDLMNITYIYALISKLQLLNRRHYKLTLALLYYKPKFDGHPSLTSQQLFSILLNKIAKQGYGLDYIIVLDLSKVQFSFMDAIQSDKPEWLGLFLLRLNNLKALIFFKDNIDDFISNKVILKVQYQLRDSKKQHFGLTHLNLSGLNITQNNMVLLLSWFPKLEHLNLSYSIKVNLNVLKAICNNCLYLINLNLYGCDQVDGECIKYLKSLQPNNSILPPKYESRIWNKLILPKFK